MTIRISKKALAIFAAILAMVLTAGVTYAWFTSRVSDSEANIELGTLKIGATFEIDTDEEYYEPGRDLKKEGAVSNLGTLPSVVLIDYNAAVTKVSDLDGNPLDPADYEVIENDENVVIAFDERILGYKEDATHENRYYWWQVTGQENVYLLELVGDISAEVIIDIIFDGPGMGNDYQNARLSFTSDWVATQTLDAAMIDELGISFADLKFIDNNLNGSGFSAFSSDNGAYERAAALFN